MSLLLALALAQSDDFPLRVGARWVYERDGKADLTLDAAETSEVEGEKTITLRIRGASFFWSTEAVFLNVGPAGLRRFGRAYQDALLKDEKALLLLPPRLEKGARWEGGDRTFEAEAFDPEEITVPAGRFRAWKIEYTLRAHLGTEDDFRAWYAPGTGFVRIEYWRRSTRGAKTPKAKVERLDLLRFIPERKAAPVAPPPLSEAARSSAAAAIARLSGTDVDVREKAAAELVALGVGVTPLIREALAKTEDPELRGRLGKVLESCPALELTIRAGKGKVGRPLPLEFSLRNLGPLAVDVLPALDDSDGLRYPRYGLIVRDAGGVEQKPGEIPFCAHINSILLNDFETLLPGEEIDPLGAGTFGHYMLSWKPSRPGTYTVEAVYDATGKFPDHWIASEGRREAILRRLGGMPRVRVASPRALVVVEP